MCILCSLDQVEKVLGVGDGSLEGVDGGTECSDGLFGSQFVGKFFIGLFYQFVHLVAYGLVGYVVGRQGVFNECPGLFTFVSTEFGEVEVHTCTSAIGVGVEYVEAYMAVSEFGGEPSGEALAAAVGGVATVVVGVEVPVHLDGVVHEGPVFTVVRTVNLYRVRHTLILVVAGSHLHGNGIYVLEQVELEVVERPNFFTRFGVGLLGRVTGVPRGVPEVLHLSVNEDTEVLSFFRVGSVGCNLVGRSYETVDFAEVEPLLHFVRLGIVHVLAVECHFLVDIVFLHLLSLFDEFLELGVEFGLAGVFEDELEVFLSDGADGPAGRAGTLGPCHGVGIVTGSVDTGHFAVAYPVVVVEEGPEAGILGAGLHGVEVDFLVKFLFRNGGHLLVVGVDDVDVASGGPVLEVVAVLDGGVDDLPYHVLQTDLLVPVVTLEVAVIDECGVGIGAVCRGEAPLQTVLGGVGVGLVVAVDVVVVLIERTTLGVTPVGEDVVTGLERYEAVEQVLPCLSECIGKCFGIAFVDVTAVGSIVSFGKCCKSLFAILSGVDTGFVVVGIETFGEEFVEDRIKIAESVLLAGSVYKPNVGVVVRTAAYVSGSDTGRKSEQIGIGAVLVFSIVGSGRNDDHTAVSGTIGGIRKVESLSIGPGFCHVGVYAVQGFGLTVLTFYVIGVVRLEHIDILDAHLPCTLAGGTEEILISGSVEVIAVNVLDVVHLGTVGSGLASSLESVEAGLREVAGKVESRPVEEGIATGKMSLSALESVLHTGFDGVGTDGIVHGFVVAIGRSGHTSCSKQSGCCKNL